jgi:hypothetical protein
MSLIVATLALAAAEPVAEPPAGNEIEVIGRRLRKWRGSWNLIGDAIGCQTTRSSGDKAVDAIGCNAVVDCMQPLAPQWKALTEARLPDHELKSKANALLQEAGISECVAAKREAGIAALAEQRRSKRS